MNKKTLLSDCIYIICTVSPNIGLYHIETEILDKNDDRAKVIIKGSLKRAIRTIYSVISDIPFINIGKRHKIEGIIDLIKEDGIWKVDGIRKTSSKTSH